MGMMVVQYEMRKLFQDLILYLEEWYHELNYLLEVNSLWFFREDAINVSNAGGYDHELGSLILQTQSSSGSRYSRLSPDSVLYGKEDQEPDAE